MRKSIYEFSEDDAYRFASEQGIEVRRVGDQLRFKYCPYCKGNNPRFDKDTFAISLENGQFNCLRSTCGAKGNMLTLASDFDFSLGREVDEYYRPKRKFRDLRSYPRPEEIRSSAIEYLEARGISSDIARRYSITAHKDDDRRLCIPFYDEFGVLQLVKYRNMDFKKGDKGNKEWSLPGCRPILFGMDKCNPKTSDTLVMTEGQIDSLSLSEAGIVNAVSVPTGARGFTWVPYCWNFMWKFKKLIVFGDYEDGNITLLEDMKKRFHGVVYHVREEDYLGCKDANEILVKHGRKALRNAVDNAVIVGSNQIKRLSEVERKNPADQKTVKTGLATLDRTTNGLYLGNLVILTGERGNGKSTMASQIMSRAIEQGYTSFIYSGELMDWIVQDWIDRQLVGPEKINALKSNLGYVSYMVNPDVLESLHAWYEDKCFIYDNDSALRDDEEEENLLALLEKSIQMYGCQVLMVDNLMTAMSDDLRVDLYRQQSNFIKQLAKMAKRYDVMILLVAHPRKSLSDSFRNDDILGSSNITNLADVIIRYDKPKEDKTDINPPDRILQITKNRQNGKTHPGINLYFDDASKRISEMRNEFGWKIDFKEPDFVSIDDDFDEIPF